MTLQKTRFLVLPAVALLFVCAGLLGLVGQRPGIAYARADATVSITVCTEAALRAAINTASPGTTLIFTCSGTIPITGTPLTIPPGANNLTLDGNGQKVTLDGGGTTQVFVVNTGITFTLQNITVAHGSAANGGGLDNFGTVNISDSTVFSSNTASGPGGGLFNNGGTSGTVTVSGSKVTNNHPNDCAGPIRNGGGNKDSDRTCGF